MFLSSQGYDYTLLWRLSIDSNREEKLYEKGIERVVLSRHLQNAPFCSSFLEKDNGATVVGWE